jgi:hypothetical protein
MKSLGSVLGVKFGLFSRRDFGNRESSELPLLRLFVASGDKDFLLLLTVTQAYHNPFTVHYNFRTAAYNLSLSTHEIEV